jgi:hypothetical protein
MRGWLDRFSISSISSMSSDGGTCIQIETSARAEADKIACVLESIYIGNGPLNVVRGDTEEGSRPSAFLYRGARLAADGTTLPRVRNHSYSPDRRSH